MGKHKTQAADKLQALIWQRWGKTDEYRIEYHSSSKPVSTGYVYRGYYLVDRTLYNWAVKRTHKSPDWEQYVNGEHIGSNYESARQYIIENIADRQFKRTQGEVDKERDAAQQWERESAGG